MRVRLLTIAAAWAFCAVWSAPAHGAFPGVNGKIASGSEAYPGSDNDYLIETLNPDGTGQTALTQIGNEYAPAFSPDGKKIAWACEYGYLCTMNADGSAKTAIFAYNRGSIPVASWSPDGTKLVFAWEPPPNQVQYELYTINADGTGMTDLGVSGQNPAWSPDGKKIAFDRGPGHPALVVMNADGTGQVLLTAGIVPSWSPDSSRIAFLDGGNVFVINGDGTDRTQLTNSGYDGGPAWSPDGTKIAFGSIRDHVPYEYDFGSEVGELYVMNADGTNQTRVTHNDLVPAEDRISFSASDWQPIPIDAYPRPKGATPVRVPLVIAYNPCTAANSTHSAPLAFPSCAPPQMSSTHVTVGTPDNNGRPPSMQGYVRLNTIPGNPATPADEADVGLILDTGDVFNKDLTDYTGGLRATLSLRVTDKDNMPRPNGPGAATVEDFTLSFDAPCTADPDTNIGSHCAVATTADALIPGAVKEKLRSIWALDAVRVFDGGSDGDPQTTADNTLFATQGVFIP